MSSRQYTVTVKLKDDGLLKKLEGVNGGGSGKSGGNSGVFAGGGDVFKRLESLGMGQLLKLTGIGIGVGSLVALTIKSSAMLQGTFKLWENTAQLILKPIGDFVALALRPITMALLTQMVIPFYKNVYPFFRDYGKKVGDALVQQGTDIKTIATSIGQGAIDLTGGAMLFKFELETKVKEAWEEFTKTLSTTLSTVPAGIVEKFTTLGSDFTTAFTDIPGKVVDKFTTLGTDLQTFFAGIPAGIVTKFTDLGTDLVNGFTYIPKVFSDTFFNLATNLWNDLLDIPGNIVDVFTGLAGDISTALAGIPGKIYDAIMGWIHQLTGGLLGSPSGGGIQTTSTSSGGSSSRTRTTMAGIADTARV